MSANLVSSLLDSVKAHPDKLAVVADDGCASYRELQQRSSSFASRLLEATPVPQVALMLPNSLCFAWAYFGVLAAGKVAVPLNFQLSPSELEFVVRDSDARLILTSSVFAEKLAPLNTRLLVLDELQSTLAGPVEQPIESLPTAASGADELAMILYTSGSTGRPKGVMLSHGNLLANVRGCINALSLTEDEVILGVLPMFHSFALTTTLLLPVVLGGTVVLLGRFSPAGVLSAIQQHKVTLLPAVPAIYGAMVRAARGLNVRLPSLKVCISGGEPLPVGLADGFQELLGLPLAEGYGLTETAPVVAVNPPQNPRQGSVGRVLPGVQVRIDGASLDESTGRTQGEILVKGANVTRGYYKLPDETRSAFTDDGWLRTGDVGWLDDEGFLYIGGRKKELIIVGGENVFPGEVEKALIAHPSVQQAAVVGVPDAVRGEVPKAFVVLAEGKEVSEQELRTFCRGKLASFKVPREIEFREELPLGATGKVLKRLLVREERS